MNSSQESALDFLNATTATFDDFFLSDLNTTMSPVAINIETKLDWIDYTQIAGLSLVAMFGIPGNALLVLVQYKSTEMSSADYLVANLAIVDLIDSSAMVGMQIYTSATRGAIPSILFCRFMAYLAYWTGISSAIFIGTLSIDRYLLTCRPFTNYSKKASKFQSVYIHLASLIICLPTFIFQEYNDATKTCAYTLPKTFMDVYFMSLAILFVVDFNVVAVLYSKIAYKLRMQLKKREAVVKSLSKSTKQDFKVKEIICKTRSRTGFSDIDKVDCQNTSENANRAGDEMASRQYSCIHNTTPVYNEATVSSTKVRKKATNRATLIIFLMSVIYILSFAIVSMIIFFKKSLGRAFYQLVPLVQEAKNIANPVLFVSMSSKFRNNVNRTVCRRFKKYS